MKIFIPFIFSLLIHFSASCQIGYVEKGNASYYAHFFHGKLTANGEFFDMNALTAAHPTLAFDCLVKVINLKNNKSVIVRINDRGPYCKNRILDLSHSAAHQLDLLTIGVTKIKLEVIGYYNKEKLKVFTQWKSNVLESLKAGNFYSANGETELAEGYGVQIAAFQEINNAIKACKKFQLQGQVTHIKVLECGKERLYRIIIGLYQKESKAVALNKKLKRKGWNGFIVKFEHQKGTETKEVAVN